jgi:hypothetical protein
MRCELCEPPLRCVSRRIGEGSSEPLRSPSVILGGKNAHERFCRKSEGGFSKGSFSVGETKTRHGDVLRGTKAVHWVNGPSFKRPTKLKMVRTSTRSRDAFGIG